jgi:uncharacterized membrane protein
MVHDRRPDDPGPERFDTPLPPPASVRGGRKTSTGLDENVAGALAYALTWVTGIVFYVLEKENRFVRFHAMQSIIFGAIWTGAWVVISLIFGSIPLIGWLFAFLGWFVIGLGGLAVWLLLMLKAYQGQMWRLPVIGDVAARMAEA